MEIDATRDRINVDESFFLVLTNFGEHAIHHLIPTVDHAYLHICSPIFNEICEEFGIYNQKVSSWELMKGAIKQLSRHEPRVNYRGAPDSFAKELI